MKKLASILVAIALLFLGACSEAPMAIIDGRVSPAAERVEISVIGSDVSALSAPGGGFSLTGVPAGTHDLEFSSAQYSLALQVEVKAGQRLDLGRVQLKRRVEEGSPEKRNVPDESTETDDSAGPKEPLDPDDSEEPTDPDNPTDPDEPGEPAEPVDLGEPNEPQKPEEPADPAGPDDPHEPADPVTPDDPAEPADPEDSNEPVDPDDPEEPADPSAPEEPADPAEPSDAGDPGGEEDPGDPPSSPPDFTIDLRFTGSGLTSEYRQAFEAAASRWSDVISAGGSSVSVNKRAGDCSNTPAFSGTVQDLVILVKIELIDGPGGILGAAGPCIIRRDSHLPALGDIHLDSADLAGLHARGQLVSTIMHEIGHVLGIGTLWDLENLISFTGNNSDCTSTTVFSQLPVFRGDKANQEYVQLGGSGGPPVEENYGPGTKCGHWRKGTFGNELMTGILTSGGPPLSKLTVASLADLGYTVNVDRADDYQLPACNPFCLQPQSIVQFEEILLLPEFFTAPQ